MASRTFPSLAAHAQFLERSVMMHGIAMEELVVSSAEVLKTSVRAVFGDLSKLKTLADATQEERLAHGYTANDPLVRSGELRDSVEGAADGMIAAAGSSDRRMPTHEFGSVARGIPPRPVFEIGSKDAQPAIEALMIELIDVTFDMRGEV